MGWIMFFIWIFLGIVLNICLRMEKETPKSQKWCGMLPVTWVFLITGIAGLAILLLYGLGWIWYYFCSGFLIFEDQPFWDKIICGLISLFPLSCVLGLIAIAFGWDPWKR